MKIELNTVGTCVTRNGVSQIGQMRVATDRGVVEVHFVSKKLKRSLHAGFVIPMVTMDELCERWLKQREGDRLPGNEGLIVQALDAAADAVARARVLVKGEQL
jgi:hypothetical protein